MGSVPSKRSSHSRGRAPPGNKGEGRPTRKRGAGKEETSQTRKPDFAALIRQTLFSYNDVQLYRLTRHYKARLQRAIEQFVEDLSSALAGRTILKEEYERIRDLLLKGQRSEAAEYLLDTVLENGARGGRAMWASLTKVKSSTVELRALLKEIQEEGPRLPLRIAWQHLDFTLPNYTTVIEAAHQRHKEKLREGLERSRVPTAPGGPAPTDYPDLLAVWSVQSDSLAAHENLTRAAMRESMLREEAEDEARERRLRGHFSKRPIEMVAPRRELFGHGFGQHGGLTVLGGASGMGKTAVLRRLVGEWASSEAGPNAIYPQFQFLLYFELERESEADSLQGLTLATYPHLANELSYLWQTPEAVLLIFDGLDRVRGWHESTQEMAVGDPTAKCPLPGVLWALARGVMLPGCCVLLAGRPGALKLLQNTGAILWLEVAGLNEGAREAYMLEFHAGSAEQGQAALERARQNAYLWGLCLDPAYCWLTCSSPVDDSPPPRTTTQVLARYLHGVLRQWTGGDPRDLVFRAGEMALEGLSQRNGLFGEEDFRRHGLEPSQLEPGLVQRATGKEEASYTFRLPVLQEFVAALGQYLAPERRNLLELLRATQAADDGRYQGFLRFLMGLSARVSSRQLEQLLPSLPHRSVCEAIFWMESLVQAEVKKRELSRRRLLSVAHYLQEGRNQRLARLLARSISQMMMGSERAQHGVRLDPSDCTAVCYVFQHSESLDTFSFENCYMQAEGIKHLLAAFLNCKRLSLVGNNLCDEGVRTLCVVLRDSDCKVIEIELAKNNLTRACIADVLSAIGQNVSIVALSLNRNNLGDIGVQHLTEGLQFPGCRIEVLQLDGNRLTEACAKGLSDLLQSLTKLSWLILDKNQLGDAGLRKLTVGLSKSKIRKLGMGFNGLTDLAVEYLVSSLCVTRSIQFLYLTGNYFTDKSVASFTTLIRNLPRLRRLWLGKNTLSAEGKQLLLDVQESKPELKVLL